MSDIVKDKYVYSGKNLINNSRWVHFILHVKIPDIERLCLRLEELIRENQEYCIAGNFPYMSDILTMIGLYELFLSKTHSRLEAYYKIAEPLWEYTQKYAYDNYKKSRHGGKDTAANILNLMKEKQNGGRTFSLIEEKTAAKSKALRDPAEDAAAEQAGALPAVCGIVRLKCESCIYAGILKKYGLAETGAMFCYADDIAFGSLKNTGFQRQHSYCIDKEPCEFTFIKYS